MGTSGWCRWQRSGSSRLSDRRAALAAESEAPGCHYCIETGCGWRRVQVEVVWSSWESYSCPAIRELLLTKRGVRPEARNNLLTPCSRGTSIGMSDWTKGVGMRIRSTAGGLGLSAALGFIAIATGSAAWACIPMASLNASPTQVEPGQSVEVTGRGYNENPVTLRFNSLDGPVLATITPAKGNISAPVTIPEGTEPGNYVLLATQEAQAGQTTWGIPSRALVTVGGPATTPVVGAPVSSVEERPLAEFERRDSVSAATLLFVGLGVAGGALFLAGLTTFAVSRQSRLPDAARAK